MTGGLLPRKRRMQLSAPDYPVVYPAAVDLLGGIDPGAIAYPAGDGAATGHEIAYYDRKMALTRSGSVIIFGHSMVQDMQESAFSPYAVAYGYGGESSRGTINRMRRVDGDGNPNALHRGSCGIIFTGVNDFSNTGYYGPVTNHAAADYVGVTLFGQFAAWATGKWIVVAAIHIDETIITTYGGNLNAEIDRMNATIVTSMAACAADYRIVNINSQVTDGTGKLLAAYHRGDGQHLSLAGEEVLHAAIASALNSLGIQQ